MTSGGIVRIGFGTLLGLVLFSSPALCQGVAAGNVNGAARPGYVGDAACVSCHSQQSKTFASTAHHLSSQLPSLRSILGSFREGSNVLNIVDPANREGEPALYFKMEFRGDAFFETAVTGDAARTQRRSERIDLVTGSGKRGQTYLYWQGDRLYELPVSFWREGGLWINSPGYIDGTANFARPVQPGCLECHATFIEPLSPEASTNRFRRESLIAGISCETCHGAGAAHVARRRARKTTGTAQTGIAGDEILNPAKFSRDRKVDLCAVCHSGIQREPLAPAFSYIPGRPISEFYKPISSEAAEHPDVHGNQVGLLQRSRCYISSPEMSCSTCHDTHAQGPEAESYSSRCMTCHQWQSCGVSAKLGIAIKDQCITCHMPVEPTVAIVSETAGRLTQATMRNHWIKVYPEASLSTGKQQRKPSN
jgi:hypothetical protein